MRLHLPKGLLAALLAACFASTVPLAEAGNYLINGTNVPESITLADNGTDNSSERVLFIGTGTDKQSITYAGDITSQGGIHWFGPGNSSKQTSAAQASCYVNLTGVISGSGTLQFNEHCGGANNSGRNVVWELSGTAANTFTGGIQIGHGGAAGSYVQLSLNKALSGSNLITLENKANTVLHVASDVTLAGLSGGGSNGGNVTAVSGVTLTLNVAGKSSYSGTLGTETKYFTTDTYANTAPLDTDTSAAVNLTKTGTGTQNLNGTNRFGTLNVEQGTLGLGGTTTLTGTTTVSSGATLSNTGTLTNDDAITVSSGALLSNTATLTNEGTITISSGALLSNTGTLTNNNAITVSSGATLSNTGTLTNNGTLTVNGTYKGATISQGETASLSLGGDSVINLDGLTVVQAAAWGDAPTESGWQTATAASQYRLFDGGSVLNSGAEFRVGGSEFTATLLNGVVSLTESRYNIIAGDSVAISAITEATNAPSAPSKYYIYVSQGGTLTGVSGALGVGVSGSGTIQTSGALTFDGRLNTFTGSIEIGSGGIVFTDVRTECSNNLVLKEASKITSQSGTVNISGVISGAYGLTIAGGGVTILSGVNTFTGGITVQEGTLKLSGVERREFCGPKGNSVTVESGATFDLNGTHSQSRIPEVTLKGGTLANSGGAIASDRMQLGNITLNANSWINAVENFGIIKSYYADAKLDLGSNNTLTKVGSAEFYAASTDVTGTGKIRIEAGAFTLFTQSGYTASSLRDGVAVELAGGELKGSFETKGKSDGTSTTVPVVTIHGEKDGRVSAAITNNGTLKVTSEAGKVVTFSGAITNGADGAVLQIGDTSDEGTAISGTAKLTKVLNAATVGQIKVLNGSSLILYGNNPNGNYTGTITVDEGGKMLATNNGNYNIVNGGSGKLVLNGEFTIDTMSDTNNVNGISGSGVVKTAQNATLNMDSASNFTGSVVSSGESDKSVTLAFAEGTTASLKKLSATNGSTLNAKGIADYSVTTDPDSHVKTATGGLSVSELVIGTGSKVQAWGSGDAWAESTEATVLMKGADGSPVTLTVGTAGQTGTSTLNANLVLDGATVTLNNALTMGSTLTLNNVTLSMSGLLGGHIAEGTEITLFTGVDSLTLGSTTYNPGDIVDEEGKRVDAGKVFTNLGTGNFLLTYTGSADGGIVALVAQRAVPEPTTATLSLLALMGLAARRRRRRA